MSTPIRQERHGNGPSNLWLSSAIYCSPPLSASPARAHWSYATGGPIHPIRSYVSGVSFPLAWTMAVHIRVQGTGQGELSVNVADENGSALEWGTGFRGPARRAIRLTSEPDRIPDEYAATVVLPKVSIPHPGDFEILVTLSSSGRQDYIDRIALKVRAFQAGHASDIPEDWRARDIKNLLRDLGPRLAPDLARAFRLAGAESRRLGHAYCGYDHLTIGLRQVLGDASGLPRTRLLREALEGKIGLNPPPLWRRDINVTPYLAKWLRAAAISEEQPLDARVFLGRLIEIRGVSNIVKESELLASRRPR